MRRLWSPATGFGLLLGVWLSGAAGAAPLDRPLPAWTALPDPLRITAFGTSLTARAVWPDRLEEALAACLGQRVDVTRVAQSGMGSAWALTRTAQVAATAPDLVLLEFAINDADLRDGLYLRDSRANHLALVADLRAALPGTRILMMTMNPVRGLLRRAQRPRLAAYDAMLREVASAGGTGLADFAPRWQGAGLVAPDGLHPDPETAAALMVPVLTDMIARAAGRSGCAAP